MAKPISKKFGNEEILTWMEACITSRARERFIEIYERQGERKRQLLFECSLPGLIEILKWSLGTVFSRSVHNLWSHITGKLISIATINLSHLSGCLERKPYVQHFLGRLCSVRAELWKHELVYFRNMSRFILIIIQ